jgi:mannan endo-1,4-beta-mannosidase
MKKILLISLLNVFGFINNLEAQTFISAAEAEDGVLTGMNKGTAIAGYSGSGYVTGMDNTGDKFSVTLEAPTKGIYRLVIRYNGPNGDKSQDLYVNGNFSSNLKFPGTTGYSDLDAGGIFLNAGSNTIDVQKNWGWTDFDKLSIYTVPLHTYIVTPNLVDPNANADTKKLYSFLTSQYGKKIISGQTNDYFNELKTIATRTPMLQAFDMQNYSPHNPWHSDWSSWDDGTVKSAIDWYNSTNKKGIVSFQWHWFSPSGGTLQKSTFYTAETNFDVSKAVINGNQEYTEVIRDIDAIAVQLKRLQDANVPVLWRPMHEAGGGWFWWGAKGSDASKALYNIMYDRLVNHHNLHNLIWVWSTPEANWYPANAKVDIIGYDSYPGAYVYSSQKSVFDQLYTLVNGEKLVAMTENGPIPDIKQCQESDAMWSWFMSWGSGMEKENSAAHIKYIFTHPDVLTLESVITSVSEPDRADENILVYPNPSSGTLYIRNALNSVPVSKIELLDMIGNLKLSIVNDSFESIQTTGLPAGMYLLKLYSPNTIYIKKVIIQ